MATPGSGLELQSIDKGDNDLTKFIRSIEGLSGQQGQKTVESGSAKVQQGVGAAAPALDFLTKLVKGDQADITQAAQPEIDQITQQFDQIRNLISLQPRGGGKTSAMAEAPFQKAGAIQRTEGEMRTKATGQLGDLSTKLAGIGLSEEGLGLNLESLASNIALGKSGQNVQENAATMQMIGALGQGVGDLLGGFLASKKG